MGVYHLIGSCGPKGSHEWPYEALDDRIEEHAQRGRGGNVVLTPSPSSRLRSVRRRYLWMDWVPWRAGGHNKVRPHREIELAFLMPPASPCSSTSTQRCQAADRYAQWDCTGGLSSHAVVRAGCR